MSFIRYESVARQKLMRQARKTANNLRQLIQDSDLPIEVYAASDLEIQYIKEYFPPQYLKRCIFRIY